MICSMEEAIIHKCMMSSRTDSKNRKLARRKQHLSFCSEEGCDIIAHSCCPNDTKLCFLPQFTGKTCFEIAHSPEVANMFTTITRDGKSYQRTIPTHPICKQLKEVYEELAKPIRGRPKKAKIGKELSDISLSNTDTESEEESIIKTRAQKRKVTESPTKVTKSEQEDIQIPRTQRKRSQTQAVRRKTAPAKAPKRVVKRSRAPKHD